MFLFSSFLPSFQTLRLPPQSYPTPFPSVLPLLFCCCNFVRSREGAETEARAALRGSGFLQGFPAGASSSFSAIPPSRSRVLSLRLPLLLLSPVLAPSA